MPQRQYTVQAPDGRTITLEGPDGASEKDVIAQAQRLFPQSTPPALPDPIGGLASDIRNHPGVSLLEGLGDDMMRDPAVIAENSRKTHNQERFKSGVSNALKPFHSPVEFAKDVYTGATEPGNWVPGLGAARNLVGIGQDIAQDPEGAVSELAGTLGTGALIGKVPSGIKAGLNKVTTPEALWQRAANLRKKANATGPLKGGYADDAMAMVAGRAIGGVPGAAVSEGLNLARQLPAARNLRANVYSRTANWMKPDIIPGSGGAELSAQMAKIPQQNSLPRAPRPGTSVLDETANINRIVEAQRLRDAQRLRETPENGVEALQQQIALIPQQTVQPRAPQITPSEPPPDMARMEAASAARKAAYDAIPEPVVGLSAAQMAQAPQVNRWMNVAVKELNHGANPGVRIVSEKLLATPQEASAVTNTGLTENGRLLTATRFKVKAALEDAGKQLGDKLAEADTTGARVNALDIVNKHIDAAIKKWGAPKDEAFRAQLEGLRQGALEQFPDLQSMPPTGAHAFKKWAGDAINWHSTKVDPINQAKVGVYRDLNAQIKIAAPKVADIQTRWGDLYIADKGLGSAISKDVGGRTPADAFKTIDPRMEILKSMRGRQ